MHDNTDSKTKAIDSYLRECDRYQIWSFNGDIEKMKGNPEGCQIVQEGCQNSWNDAKGWYYQQDNQLPLVIIRQTILCN